MLIGVTAGRSSFKTARVGEDSLEMKELREENKSMREQLAKIRMSKSKARAKLVWITV